MAESLRQFVLREGGTPSYLAEPWYNLAGDCIEYHFVPDESYADRVDSVLTVFRSVKTDEIVGCQVKGITALHQILGDFSFHFQAGNASLGVLILGAFYSGTRSRYADSERKRLYDDLRGRLGQDGISREIPVYA